MRDPTASSTTAPSPDTRDEQLEDALAKGGVIDITTNGRRTGLARRIEIVFFNIGGRVYISGLPGPRAWYANLLADPRFTFHLKGGRVEADIAAVARPITEEQERRVLLIQITRQWRRESQLEAFVSRSPLIEVTFQGDALAA